MRIASVGVERYADPRPHALVRVTDVDGREGLGEAAPLPGYSRETFRECLCALDHWTTSEVGELGEVAEDSLDLALQIFASVPAARAAAETALLDLIAQGRGVSIAAVLLGGEPRYETVAVNGLVESGAPDSLAERAVALAHEGYTSLKIKLRSETDASFELELKELRTVRRALPLPYELRLDPNGAWPLDTARRRLAALVEVAPAYVEQPCVPDELLALGRCAVPWAADESLANEGHSDALLAGGVCGGLVLKPAYLGGLIRARRLTLRALERGIPFVVTHLRDGPVGIAAARELAFSLPVPPRASGLGVHGEVGAFSRAQGIDLPPIMHTPSGFVVRRGTGPGLTLTSRGRG